jgi:hypothetical protein
MLGYTRMKLFIPPIEHLSRGSGPAASLEDPGACRLCGGRMILALVIVCRQGSHEPQPSRPAWFLDPLGRAFPVGGRVPKEMASSCSPPRGEETPVTRFGEVEKR